MVTDSGQVPQRGPGRPPKEQSEGGTVTARIYQNDLAALRQRQLDLAARDRKWTAMPEIIHDVIALARANPGWNL